MMALARARELDAADDPMGALVEYEKALRSGQETLDVFLDLAVLYFTLLDPGEAAARGLSQEFTNRAWNRANEILDEAERRYEKKSEIRFWRLYFGYIVLGTKPFVEKCRNLVNADESLVPFFYLWRESRCKEHCAEINELCAKVAAGKTARERYVRSMVSTASSL